MPYLCPPPRHFIRPSLRTFCLCLLLGVLWSQPTSAQVGSRKAREKTLPGLGLQALTVERPAFRQSCRQAETAMFRGMLAPGDEERVRRYREAESAARGAVGLAPDRPEGHYLLAVTLGLRIDFVGALQKVRTAQEIREVVTRLLELDPDHAGGHHLLGRLHAGVMRMQPLTRFVARRLTGSGTLKQASWKRAERHLRRAEELEPQVLVHHLELGILYLETGRPERALEEMNHVLARGAVTPVDSLFRLRALEIRSDLLAGRSPSNPTSLIRGREALDARGSSPEGPSRF